MTDEMERQEHPGPGLVVEVVKAVRGFMKARGLAVVFPSPEEAALLRAVEALEVALVEEAGGQEEPGHWEPSSWRYVEAGDHVRLGEAEATVASAVRLNWHVDPASPDRYPRPLETSSVQVVLEGKNGGRPYTMPPSGPVDIWRPALPDWAGLAFAALKEAGMKPARTEDS